MTDLAPASGSMHPPLDCYPRRRSARLRHGPSPRRIVASPRPGPHRRSVVPRRSLGTARTPRRSSMRNRTPSSSAAARRGHHGVLGRDAAAGDVLRETASTSTRPCRASEAAIIAIEYYRSRARSARPEGPFVLRHNQTPSAAPGGSRSQQMAKMTAHPGAHDEGAGGDREPDSARS